ncbi:hypothetical protein, partial [Holdemania sp. 1001302B_160321_E10]|uniref:hypothetical protein n=1 Tax=Holdemania sp. 1001302B_160321_E10 TaxID=2787120 RepID=UPI001E352709
REIQDDYNSFARVNAVRVFAKVNAIPFSLKAAFTFSIHLKTNNIRKNRCFFNMELFFSYFNL